MTLAELLISLRNRLNIAIEQDDHETCGYLQTTFNQMTEASFEEGNDKLLALLDDMHYAAQHSSARHKADDAIPTDEKIMAVFHSDETDEKVS